MAVTISRTTVLDKSMSAIAADHENPVTGVGRGFVVGVEGAGEKGTHKTFC